MKLFFVLVAMVLANAGEPRPELAEIKTVYLLPMTYALDQFLAIRLTKGGVVQVVTDPKKADAIISDHIGTALEEKMDSLYGEQKAVKSADGAPVSDKDKDKDKDDKDQNSFGGGPMAGGTRSKGAVFLVDPKTRNVLWSDYVPPKNSQPGELNHVADKIAAQFEKDKRGK
jgi:hypothetical protein